MMEETQLGQNCSTVPGPDNIGTILGTATSLGLVLSPESMEFLDTNFILLNKIRNGQIIQMVFYLNKTSENVKIIQRNNKLIYFCCKANKTVKLVKLI